ncbi:MAG: SCO family protein [Pseudomonadota bacterium]|nr:SCO family protein [Pseudomonadota bacterium]HJO35020.1 SCO family protein [Gammaproteobacteria bacterium]
MNRPLSEGNRRSGQGKLLLLALVFFGPLAAAWLYYAGLDEGALPGDRANRGVLIRPARPIAATDLRTPDGEALGAQALRGRWTLVYLDRGQCEQACEDHLYELRQVDTALGRESTRVARLYVSDEAPDRDRRDYLQTYHPRLQVAMSPADGAFRGYFESLPAAAEGAHIFVIDPLGNLMMTYGPDQPAKDVYKDLKRLLRISRIG